MVLKKINILNFFLNLIEIWQYLLKLEKFTNLSYFSNSLQKLKMIIQRKLFNDKEIFNNELVLTPVVADNFMARRVFWSCVTRRF